MLALSSLNAQEKPAEYDLVILNGRVMDPETMFDAIANVGIKDGKIVMITKSKITGKEIINAKGHVVAPGFIDPHSHNVPTPFGQKLALRDGVTTPLELELGVLPINFWYDQMKGKSQTNYGASASIEAAREKILNPTYQTSDAALINDASIMDETHLSMAWSKDVASDEQVNQILDLVEEGLKQGGLGIGYTPGYMVYGVRSEEGVGAQKLAGKYRRFVYLHGRFSGQLPPNDGLTGTLQQLGAAEAYGGGLVIAHMTAQTLSQTKEAQAIIDAAARKGIPVISEIYAYTYGSTIVAADYLEPDNYQNNMGHDYKDIVNLTDMKPLTKETYEQLKKDAPTTNVTFENATKEDLYWALSHPTSIIGSDAFPGVSKIDKSLPKDWDTPYESVNAHPRGAGTHARILRLVREENLMSLMLAVSKMTFMPAKFLQENGVDQMANKGRLQVGKDADITIFDPATIKDNATPQMGTLPSTGIPYVIVNGTVVVKDSKVLKDVYPGQPIRAEIQE
ncbi:N-acyl-D-glutamate deacylase [Muriicola jejuensis]|nr:N-acyl-D-glutamate deacylase [Muriicola jejuensis]